MHAYQYVLYTVRYTTVPYVRSNTEQYGAVRSRALLGAMRSVFFYTYGIIILFLENRLMRLYMLMLCIGTMEKGYVALQLHAVAQLPTVFRCGSILDDYEVL